MVEHRDAVITSCDANWLPAAAVALWSIARHGLPDNVDLIVFVSNATEEDRRTLARFNERHGTSIDLVAIEMEPPKGLDLYHWGVGTLLILQLDRYLSQLYRRALHVDADVLAFRSVAPLLNAALHGKAFGAVDEVYWLNGGGRSAPIDSGLVADAPYFNAGVLVFDWAEVLRHRILPNALELLSNGTPWPLLNQDALNVAGAGRWHPLDLRWNVSTTIAQFRRVDPWIRHFTSRGKPWTSWCRYTDLSYRDEYVAALSGSKWEGFIESGGGRWDRALFLRILRRRFAFGRQRRLTQALRSYAA
jgi:lipopolysaccharide biosynthesis glycosyltransferase